MVQDILRTFLREMNGSFKMQFTDFNEALVQLKEAQKENIDYTTRLYQTMSNQLNTSYAKQSEAMKDLVNELGQVQGRYMSTATRITQDNQEIQKLQQQDYQRIADYLHESEKSSAKFWVACNPDNAEICGSLPRREWKRFRLQIRQEKMCLRLTVNW